LAREGSGAVLHGAPILHHAPHRLPHLPPPATPGGRRPDRHPARQRADLRRCLPTRLPGPGAWSAGRRTSPRVGDPAL